MSEEVSKEISQWLEDNAPPPPVGEGELTIQMAAEEWECSDPTAQKRLEELVESGKATKELRMSTGGERYVYIPIES